MLICSHHKECKAEGFLCIHRTFHTTEESNIRGELACTTIPCGCNWAKDNKVEATCVDAFVFLIKDAIKEKTD